MSYAKARLSAYPTQSLRGYPTQALRGYPTQPLRGLGALSQQQMLASAISPLAAQVRAGLDDLVSTARKETSKIVQSYKGSFTRFARFIQDELLPGETIGKTPADEWAANIVGYAENVRATLSRMDDKGTPFFLRQPETAQRLVQSSKSDLEGLIRELDDEVRAGSFASIVQSILDFVLSALMQIAQMIATSLGSAFAQFPIGGIAIAAVVSAVVWYKFFR